MQAIFDGKEELANALRSTFSKPRMHRYIADANDDVLRGIALYHWNAQLSQSLYLPIQVWEIAIRNKLNAFLCKKYNASWPYDEARAVRELKQNDRDKLFETRDRQERNRGVQRATTDSIVADLSAGFWVSLLGKSYDNAFVWRYNVGRVFPHDKTITRELAHPMCDRILDVRNRIAHHEPIYHLALPEIRADLERLTKAMCPGAHLYATGLCTFAAVLAARPAAPTAAAA